MTHLVLARKYRPRRFDEVVGQDLIVKTLKAAIGKDRVAHALLFTGGRGIGKTTIARLMAKAMVCLDRKDSEPCNRCQQCLAIDNFSSLDVVEIDGASHTGVDDIRDLRDSARYHPTSARYKIYIIDEVHMLSISAWNALLKILEEPPPHVMFIFATTEAHKIPKTILSRCQRYDFKRVGVSTIVAALEHIAGLEGFSIDRAGLRLIADLADGGLRDALSMTEQILGSQKDHYTADMVAEVLGVIDHQAVKQLCRHVLDREPSPALEIIRDAYEKGFDLCQLMEALTEKFRALSLCAHVDSDRITSILPDVDNGDLSLSQSYAKGDLKRLFAMALDGCAQVFSSPKPLYALELFVLRASLRPSMADATTIDFCLRKLDAILHNRPLPTAEAMLSKKAPTSPPPAHREPAKKRTEGGDTVMAFSKMLDELSKPMPALVGHLRHARPAVMNGQELLLTFEQSLHLEQAQRMMGHEAFVRALRSAFGPGISVRSELRRSADGGERPTAPTIAELDEKQRVKEKDQLLHRARSSDIVKKAIEIFGGDITEVEKIDIGPKGP